MDIFGDKGSLVAIVLLIAVMILFLRYTQRAAKASAERIKGLSQPPEQMTIPAHNLDTPTNMARWEIQMHDLARDLSGQLDTKIAILNELIRRADEQIARLERAVEKAEGRTEPAAKAAPERLPGT